MLDFKAVVDHIKQKSIVHNKGKARLTFLEKDGAVNEIIESKFSYRSLFRQDLVTMRSPLVHWIRRACADKDIVAFKITIL